MKKIIFVLLCVFLLSGCGKYNEKNLIKDINKKITMHNAYHLQGVLEIYRNEEKFTYNVDSSYKKGDNFKVSLVNQNNNHEQIILKNNEGVYVLTPSLNKSFKFQSDWPYNNSQIYLLQPILNDLSNDTNTKIKTEKNGYTITSKVDYTSEKDFVKQKVYVDKEKNITKVEVMDKNNNVKMSLTVIDIDYNPKFKKGYFKASTYKTEDIKDDKKDKTVSKIENVVYPMYVPTDTHLTSQDVVSTDDGERIILTFAGESAFTVVQENCKNSENTKYIYGDPYLILDTVGSLTDYSVSWISNGVEYSVMSDTLNMDELLTVAQSIKVAAVGK